MGHFQSRSLAYQEVKNINQNTKNYIRYLLYRTIGTPFFIRRIEWRKMFEWLYPEEGEKILDVACGGGELSLKIAERGCEVYGIDVSENAISSAKRLSERAKITCEFEVGDAEHLPYPDEYFEKIICSSSLEHFRDDLKALKEMSRVLKPNGKLVLTTDSFTYPINNELKEKHRKVASVVNYYTHEKLKERFDISGFEMCRSEYLLNSRITHFFFKLWIRLRQFRILWMVISFVAYPLCLISDRLFGVRDKGYTLIAEGRLIHKEL